MGSQWPWVSLTVIGFRMTRRALTIKCWANLSQSNHHDPSKISKLSTIITLNSMKLVVTLMLLLGGLVQASLDFPIMYFNLVKERVLLPAKYPPDMTAVDPMIPLSLCHTEIISIKGDPEDTGNHPWFRITYQVCHQDVALTKYYGEPFSYEVKLGQVLNLELGIIHLDEEGYGTGWSVIRSSQEVNITGISLVEYDGTDIVGVSYGTFLSGPGLQGYGYVLVDGEPGKVDLNDADGVKGMNALKKHVRDHIDPSVMGDTFIA